jgi:hypothetical protein
VSEPALDITPVVQQRLAWDIISCEEIMDSWKHLDLVAPSEDVATAAHTESHARMETIEPLGLVGDVYITLAADIISRMMGKHYEEEHGELPGDVERSVMMTQNTEVIRAAFYPIIAHMMESGMLQLGPTVMTPGTRMRLI